MTLKVVFVYLLVLVLGAGVGVGREYISKGSIVFPDVVLTALLFAVLAEMVLITAHAASRWGVEGPDVDLDVGE